MVKEYAVGEKYYLPVRVREIMDDTYTYPVRIGFESGNGCMDGKSAVKGIPGILLTAEDIATVINTERDDALAELKARNAELEALLKEVTATRDEAIRQNDELRKENDNLRSQVGKNLAEIQDLNAEVHFLNAEKEQEAKAEKTVHVVLNDGTGYNFYKCTKASFDNYGNFTVLKVYRGEEYVAGFLRGDKPGNFAYWWTE